MDLQLALLLIGVFIVGAVALSAYDRARVGNSMSRRDAAHSHEPSAPPVAQLPIDSAPLPDPVPAPVRPRASKILVSRPPTPVLQKSAQNAFYEEIRELEQVAAMPLPRGLKPVPGTAIPATPDEAIDFVISLPGPGPVMRDQALSVYKQNEYLLEKARNIYGLRLGIGIWTNVERDPPEAEYGNLALALQMMDSKGPVSESELNTFAQLSIKLADALHRPTRLAVTFEEAMARAEALRHFANEYDVIASVSVLPISVNGFPGRAVASAAARFGLEFGARKIFHFKNNQGAGMRHLFSMANLFEPGTFDIARLESQVVRGLTLFMHVPGLVQPVRAFEKMAETGRRLCEVLGGKLVDQDQRPLLPEGVAVIKAQIDSIADAMQKWGIAAGSATALRLFESE